MFIYLFILLKLVFINAFTVSVKLTENKVNDMKLTEY